MERYQVSLEKENLVFSAAHFITFNGDICESLHGHNYRVKCEVEGKLDENHYVIDFIALRDTLLEVLGGLDHSVVLPTRHSMITVKEAEDEVLVSFQDRRWVFPADNCRLLPIENTTAERLAWYIGKQLWDKLGAEKTAGVTRLKIFVDENYGQWASWESDQVGS